MEDTVLSDITSGNIGMQVTSSDEGSRQRNTQSLSVWNSLQLTGIHSLCSIRVVAYTGYSSNFPW